jgi:hypothetical protein
VEIFVHHVQTRHSLHTLSGTSVSVTPKARGLAKVAHLYKTK